MIDIILLIDLIIQAYSNNQGNHSHSHHVLQRINTGINDVEHFTEEDEIEILMSRGYTREQAYQIAEHDRTSNPRYRPPPPGPPSIQNYPSDEMVHNEVIEVSLRIY